MILFNIYFFSKKNEQNLKKSPKPLFFVFFITPHDEPAGRVVNRFKETEEKTTGTTSPKGESSTDLRYKGTYKIVSISNI